jgi:hypothetical protein
MISWPPQGASLITASSYSSGASLARERAALVRLLDTAGESGLRGNINFA